MRLLVHVLIIIIRRRRRGSTRSTSGLTLVGHNAWFGTTFGDFFSANTFVCQ
ncbi:MAG TPA: hypothetical protein VL049_11040 [Candidatus Dormibacteraeota bacterium]|nr:hypothetical protein [Candidatus Dormibacteraeota bacterium]